MHAKTKQLVFVTVMITVSFTVLLVIVTSMIVINVRLPGGGPRFTGPAGTQPRVTWVESHVSADSGLDALTTEPISSTSQSPCEVGAPELSSSCPPRVESLN